MNVLFELETEGEEFIWTQELKLSDETWIVSEHEVPDELEVTEVVSIDSEKTIDMEELTDTEVSEFDGVEDETVGDVVSGWFPVVNPNDVVHSELKILPELSLTPVVTRIL